MKRWTFPRMDKIENTHNKEFVESDDILYRELFTPLFRYLFFRTKDYDVANDLTQASFLKFLSQKDKPKEKLHAHKLLYTIARTKLIDYWRVEGRREHESLDSHGEVEGNFIAPDEAAILADDKMFIQRVLGRLGGVEGEVVAMRLSGDVEYEVIAVTLNISAVNARKIYSRAIQRIGEELRESNYFK